MTEKPTINPDPPPADASLDDLKEHLADLLESYGRGYTTSPTSGPRYQVAISVTADLIAAKEVARAVELADANARKHETRLLTATWALVFATIGLVLATIALAALSWNGG